MTAPSAASFHDSIRVINGASVLACALIDVLRREAKVIAAKPFEVPTTFIDAKIDLIARYTEKVKAVNEIAEVPETFGAFEELRMLNTEVLTSARRNAAQIQGAIEGNRILLAHLAEKGERGAACLSPVPGHC